MPFDFSILQHVDPGSLPYQDWLAVGMAIQHEGGTAAIWDEWSKRDAGRYKVGECFRKWDGFRGGSTSEPVTGGTLVAFARQQGWEPPQRESRALDWDDTIGDDRDDLRILDPSWVQDAEIVDPGENWDPAGELIAYLAALFEAGDYVGYVTEAWKKEGEDGRWLPKKGSYTRTAGELIQELSQCKGDLGAVLGDYKPEAGAWIRFNPLDGKGVRDENVTSYRFALIESDTLAVEKQAAIYKELELPVVALVHSGGKSLHALVRVEATSKEEYRSRVEFLHDVCRKNGLEIDGANKNPSRLSRMPGVWRNGQRQYLAGLNQGKSSWEEWKTWIEAVNDSLPDFENLADVFGDKMPPLSPPLIDGLLREGHKMLLAGPSKAGKSYILLELAMSIAEGRPWLGWPCAQGKVLYVNLELDRASCLHRLAALYEARGWSSENVANIDLWNLRGKAVPMDALAPKLIRRALKRRYKAVIIDPIYKVITGDENAADKMAFFCNQFDKVCAELGAAVIYCHHHSKGTQGQKNAMDRSSGSGVFARDPDAILDLIELVVDSDRRKQVVNRMECAAVARVLSDLAPANWQDRIGPDDMLVLSAFLQGAREILTDEVDRQALAIAIADATRRAGEMSAWRMEGTLREFPPFAARRMWFAYPVHSPDSDGLLEDAKAAGEEAPWLIERRERAKAREGCGRLSRREQIAEAFKALHENGESVSVFEMAEHLGVTEETLRSWTKSRDSDYSIGRDDIVRNKATAQNEELEMAFSRAVDLTSSDAQLSRLAEELKCSEKTAMRRIRESEAFAVCNGIVRRKETQ